MEEVKEVKSDQQSHINHCENFIRAIRDGDPLNADIEIGYRAALYAHLGNLSHFADATVAYDMMRKKIIGSDKADELITPVYRKPWILPA
jgi:hypothetical protein